MLSLIIAFIVSAIGFTCLQAIWNSPGWNIFFSVVILVAVWIIINLRLNKKLEAIFKGVQDMISGAQDKLRREVNMYQQKGFTGPRIQEKVEEKLKAAIREAIVSLDAAKPLYKWNWLIKKQVDTMKAQLYFQIKDYESADPLLDKALAFDPMLVAMKMARNFKRGNREKVTKDYESAIKRFKGDKNIIIYALYSWILVKEEKLEEAVVVLDQGKTKTDSPVLKENWEHLANGRAKRFSNAGLGEIWYSLNLEEPKQVRIRQQASPFGFGGRAR